MLTLVYDGAHDAPAPHSGIRCPKGTVRPPDASQVTAAEVVRALITIEAVRVRAASLHTGDRVVYQRGGVITIDTVSGVTGWWQRSAGRITVATEGGDRWSCAPDERCFLKVTG